MNLMNKTCGCRRWDLTGIPCYHVISCINKMDYIVEDYVHECYSTKKYKKSYSDVVYPMNGYPQ